MNLRLRPVDLQHDAALVQSLFNQFNSEPGDPADLARRWQEIPATAIWQRTLAEAGDNLAAGYAYVGRDQWDEPGRWFMSLVIDRAARGTGIGTALLKDATAFVKRQGGSMIQASVKEDDPRSLAWAKARGATVRRHLYESTLDLSTFDQTRFAGVTEALAAQGIRLTTMADLPSEYRYQLYDVWCKTIVDNPGMALHEFPPFEEWARWVLESPRMPLDCLIVALDGDRIVGDTGIVRQENGSYYTDYTGVVREYRGRGIALALKLASIRKAISSGAPYMRTNNDSNNAPMLAVNRKLGYTPCPGVYDVELTV